MKHEFDSFIGRLKIAWRVLFDADTARAAVAERSPPPPGPLLEAAPVAALQLLGLLQQEGRLVDFVEEDVTQFSDADIGAAARIVHQGCRKVFEDCCVFEPVCSEAEGSQITLPPGFDASHYRLSGNVAGEAPFSGVVVHRGWRVRTMTLPKLTAGHDASIIAQAEVEL